MPSKLKGKYNWTKKEIQELSDRFPFESNKDLSKYFNVSWRTIVRKARELNLEKHELFRIQFDFKAFAKIGAAHPNAINNRYKPGIRNSPETEFKKGNYPFFMKMSFLERMNYKKNIQ